MPRAGTTSLFHMLGEHPQVFLPFRKEMGYFLFNFDRGPEWYAAAYQERGEDQVGVDATPEYFFSRPALRRIVEHRPELRVVLGVREPQSFALSLHREYRRRGHGVPPLETFLGGYSYRRRHTNIEFCLADGSISAMIEAYRSALAERLLLYDYELLRNEPLRVLRGIEAFVGLEPHFSPATFRNLRFNSSDRRSWRAFDFLLSREWLISALTRTAPRWMLVRLSRLQYTLAAAAPGAPRRQRESAPDLRRLAGETDRIRALFAAGPLVRGDGEPFVP